MNNNPVANASANPQSVEALKVQNLVGLFYAQQIHHHGSFLEAAKHIGRSQGYLSQRIEALEKRLGHRVFIRSTRGLTLTRKGAEWMRAMTPLVNGVKGISRQGVRTETGARSIRIVSTHAMLSYVLLEPLLAYQETHAGEVVFELVGDDVHLDLDRHDADIVIRPFMHDARGITQVHLADLRKTLLASQSYIDRFGEPTKIAELKEHQLISYTDTKAKPHCDALWLLRLANRLHNPNYVTNSLECLLEYTKRGYGISALYPKLSIIQNSSLKIIMKEAAYTSTNVTACFSSHSDSLTTNVVEYLQNQLINYSD